MTASDREILRGLARQQLEAANSPVNKERVELWKRHNALKGERPVIHIEIDTFEQEIIAPRLRCADPEARRLERELYHSFLNLTLFDDDKVVPDYFPIRWETYFHLFGHEISKTTAKDSNGVELGHHFNYVIEDLHDDFQKLGPSRFGVEREATLRCKQMAEEAFGDILPVRLSGGCLYAVPTQQVVHMMGMELMYTSMYDYPDEFKTMMGRIADDYIAYFKFLEKEGYLLPTTAFEGVGQGTLAFTDELPGGGELTTKDLWGFMDSQETVGISPDMYREFIFPCYAKIAGYFGLLSYGCCEPVHPVWEMVKTFPGLRKVSISPWCDEEYMAEQLGGSRVIYHRKPSPNFLGGGEKLDEEAFRAHIGKSIRTAAAHGCKMEITQRDVYTVGGDAEAVHRYVQIIREEISKNWKS